jgi:hypothetical protein
LAGRNLVETEFDSRKLAQELLDLYARIMHRDAINN